MHHPHAATWISSLMLIALLTAAPAAASPSAQGLGEPGGPGQAVPIPAPQCARTIACIYNERNFLPDGYRVQSLHVCGANCTTQYWVSAIADGQSLLEIDPVRGGAVLALSRAAPSAAHPALRSVLPNYDPADPACCPSAFVDTTYTWDAGTNTMVAGEPALTAAADFPGWDAVRQELVAEGWQVISP
jgi:hypothetical protein